VIALLLVVRFSQMTGFQADAGVYLCCCLPVVLLLGALPAMAAVISFSFFAMRRGWLFSDDQWKVMSVAVEQRCQTLLDRFPWCSSMKVVLTVSPETTKLSDQI
jgi:hypothetical protein